MTEFELHQLIHAARAEFDLGTIVFFTLNFAFIILAVQAKDKLDNKQRNCLAISCGVVSVFLAMRIIASIIRFIKLQELLVSTNPTFDHSFLALQFPTLIARALILIGMPLVAIWFLKNKEK